jgi:hypothetical protein
MSCTRRSTPSSALPSCSANSKGAGTRTGRFVEYADLIRDAATHLLAVINDILDISKLQSGKYTVDSKAVDLDEVLQLSLAPLKPAAIARGILMESKAQRGVAERAGRRRQAAPSVQLSDQQFHQVDDRRRQRHPRRPSPGGRRGERRRRDPAVRIKFQELPAHAMPRSSSARFTEMWQKSVGDAGFLDSIVDRWRNASSAA